MLNGFRADRKVKVSKGIGLIRQIKVPPFRWDRLKSVAHHHFAQRSAVSNLVFSQTVAVGGAGKLSEIIKGTAHVYFFAGCHIKQCQINTAAAAVTGFAVYIAADKQSFFFNIGVKKGFISVASGLFAQRTK